MSRPTDLKYTKGHEWIRVEGDGSLVIGITDYAVKQLTDITHIDLPEVGDTFGKGEAFAEIDSVKTVAEVYTPLAGSVVATNKDLSENEHFEIVNREPFAGGWLIKLAPAGKDALSGLMDADAYATLVEDEEAGA